MPPLPCPAPTPRPVPSCSVVRSAQTRPGEEPTPRLRPDSALSDSPDSCRRSLVAVKAPASSFLLLRRRRHTSARRSSSATSSVFHSCQPGHAPSIRPRPHRVTTFAANSSDQEKQAESNVSENLVHDRVSVSGSRSQRLFQLYVCGVHICATGGVPVTPTTHPHDL